MTLFDDAQVLEAYAEDIKNSEARETAERMIKMRKLSLSKKLIYVPSLSLDELRKLFNQFFLPNLFCVIICNRVRAAKSGNIYSGSFSFARRYIAAAPLLFGREAAA